MFFLLTDGYATDEEGDALDYFNKVRWGVKVACGAGSNVDEETLRKISDVALRIETDSGRFKEFFKWVTQSIQSVSSSMRSGILQEDPASQLASIPPEIEIV